MKFGAGFLFFNLRAATPRKKKRCVPQIMIATIVFCGTQSAFAVENNSQAVWQQKLRILEARIEMMEKKIQDQQQRERMAPGQRKPKNTESASTQERLEPDRAASGKSTDILAPSAEADKKPDASVPQEAFIFRDLSPTLKRGKFEVSLETSYVRNTGFLQSDKMTTTALTGRVGVTDRFELSASIPYYESRRQTASLFSDLVYSTKSVSDISVNGSYSVKSQTEDWPGIAISGGAIIPAGENPYTWSSQYGQYSAGQNPVDTFRLVQSRGHYGVRGTVVGYKTVDPLLLFASVGTEYYFARTFDQGYRVAPGYRATFGAGFNFALSEKTTIGGDVRGFYSPDFSVDGATIKSSSQEQYLMRFVITQRIFPSWYIEPSITHGLTKDSPDFTATFALRYRSQ